MAHKRGKSWVASGYSKQARRKVHLGTFATKREAARVEADWKLRAQPSGQETCDRLAERWVRDAKIGLKREWFQDKTFPQYDCRMRCADGSYETYGERMAPSRTDALDGER